MHIGLMETSDAEDLQYVYAWRLEQEVTLRREKNCGMTDEEVTRFVDGCWFTFDRLLMTRATYES